MRTEVLHADSQTDGRPDMTKLIVAFRNYANEHKSTYGRIIYLFIHGLFPTAVRGLV